VDDIRKLSEQDREALRPPVEAGAFTLVYDPSLGENENWYINDHCFVRDRDGLWHLFGITHAEPAAPLDEDNLAHATAPSPQGPWSKQSSALTADADWGEEHLWAPHVIEHENRYYMFYCGGDRDHTRYRIMLATSPDLWSWTRHSGNPLFQDGFDARDPMVLRDGDQWILYYTATTEPEGGQHIVACRTSRDLVQWSERRTVFTDRTSGTFGGPTESPFVVSHGGFHYLFIGPRGGYVGTDVFRSRSPFGWQADDLVGHIDSHAAEVIRDTAGAWWVSHCGWGQGGVYLAPLTWKHDLNRAGR
jgi:beta-fructofuranosidase